MSTQARVAHREDAGCAPEFRLRDGTPIARARTKGRTQLPAVLAGADDRTAEISR